ncbi:hypothetical protein AMTR_s00096p00170210 [Amborella trichopoda]|uniref:USP domain-containing protein n=1 Tax=Amborella trichopoda TaxID=13333 RepID=W1P653_AMBTC|nr:hypothetical protein AMTR_s00096p00170210 [Amborella trichopoda]
MVELGTILHVCFKNELSSGKCQIIHWRLGHKQECVPLVITNPNSSTGLASMTTESLLPRTSVPENAKVNSIQVPKLNERLPRERGTGWPMESVFEDALPHGISQEYCNSKGQTLSMASSNSPSPPKRSSQTQPSERNGVGESGQSLECPYFYRDKFQEDSPLSYKGDLRTCSSTVDPSYRESTKSRRASFETEKAHSSNTSSPVKSVSLTPPAQERHEVLKHEDNKSVGPKKISKPPKQSATEAMVSGLKKHKMLFPYEEIVHLFACEAMELSPRGLLNCGNSCYANAVLQCLTYTKPLAIYLLQKSHSAKCWMSEWCLMCALEQHISNLREDGGPLSLVGILSHMQNVGCRIGGGSQEDAHEFLRLLVTSMQSICLEKLGGEKKVDPQLQETTFIHQIFGGCLRSKVKCLRCQHESERYENIMDLTLEILGWVGSLEDALCQFTAPEFLDGDNKYRCGRCAAYVKAKKQLRKYGKLNKCVTFPDMLDMIPYMTGTGDSPPLYMLYGVVVHLDSSNASFSGHYVSYVKDLQGAWFRIDDTEVEPVTTSHVMSEGAYILFYSRSFPRPPRIYAEKSTTSHSSPSLKPCPLCPESSPRHKHSKPPSYIHPTTAQKPDSKNSCISSQTRISPSIDSSDYAFSDGVLFTSSDDASFTTESTRDSTSTMDYSEAFGFDPTSTFLSSLYYWPDYSYKPVSNMKATECKIQTRFFFENKGQVLNFSNEERKQEEVTDSFLGPLASAGKCSVGVGHDSSLKSRFFYNSDCCGH